MLLLTTAAGAAEEGGPEESPDTPVRAPDYHPASPKSSVFVSCWPHNKLPPNFYCLTVSVGQDSGFLSMLQPGSWPAHSLLKAQLPENLLPFAMRLLADLRASLAVAWTYLLATWASL